MLSQIYNAYYMTRMLKDKAKMSIVDYYNGKYSKVQRMNNIKTTIIGNLYNLTIEPTHIIDNIYLGNAYNASNYNNLKKLNIGLVINITNEIPNYYENDFKYLNIKIDDKNGCDILQHFSTFLDTINNFKKNNINNKNILIHCFMGSSRSATLSCIYILNKYNKTVEQSIKFIKNKRPVVNINISFINDIKIWYNTRHNGGVIPLCDYDEKPKQLAPLSKITLMYEEPIVPSCSKNKNIINKAIL